MNIEKLFSGIAVIVDNEIEDPSSSIYRIREFIKAKNIPVVSYAEIPQEEVVSALSGAAFVVLDWDYTDGKLPINEDERIIIPGTLAESEESRLISFIERLLSDLFVPVFIFTAYSRDMVIEKLKTHGLWQEDHPNRIFVKQKDEVDTEQDLFAAITDWTKSMPSVYVLKEWALSIQKAQNTMFNELYGYSPYWTKIIWDMLKEDSRDNQREFGDFITKQLVNRISDYSFEEDLLYSDKPVSPEELISVVEGERYMACKPPQVQAYTGDLFYDNKEYYLNIRAQCDLARDCDPTLYLIRGEELKDKDIITEDIRLTSEGFLHVSKTKRYSLDDLKEISQDEKKLISINETFRSIRNKAFFNKGNIIGKKTQIIVPCIAGKKALRFYLEINQMPKYSEYKDKLIGRILPPYITQIQQNCASFITREGVMPTPLSVFKEIGS